MGNLKWFSKGFINLALFIHYFKDHNAVGIRYIYLKHLAHFVFHLFLLLLTPYRTKYSTRFFALPLYSISCHLNIHNFMRI